MLHSANKIASSNDYQIALAQMEIQESRLTEFNVANEEYSCPEKRKERYDS